ncbi:MAG: glutamine synthetase [Alphaproteobacteria bacterium]
MTDLDRFLQDPKRDELVRLAREIIDRSGVEYIYYQYVSITGRIMGKGAPANHWERMARQGLQTWIGGLTNVQPDRRGNLIGFGPHTHEIVTMPDPETFCQLPWDRRLARVFCTVFHMREDAARPGALMDADCRGTLRRIHARFQQDHGGLHLRHGCEPEMMWLRRGKDGGYDGGPTKPNAYHVDQFEELAPVFLKTVGYGKAMGLDMIQGDHEDAPGQLELNFTFDEALRTADRLTSYRQICARVAREHDLIACFMTKPFMRMSANGCHHNLSLWTSGRDEIEALGHDPLPGAPEVFTYRRGGTNTFLDPANPGHWLPSVLGRHAIGGILAHLPALTALGASTVNSYRRMMDTGLWAPVYADWGFQNRTCAIRVSAPGRVEYRSVDSMVNPYIMAAGLLRAMDDGITRKLDPGQPETRNIYEAMEAGKVVRRLPSNLGEALDALAADTVVRSAMPGELYRLYREYKSAEWDQFNATVSNWDVERYLDCLP